MRNQGPPIRMPNHGKKDRSTLIFVEFQHEGVAEDGLPQRRLTKDKAQSQAALHRAGEVLEAARSVGSTQAPAGPDLSHSRAGTSQERGAPFDAPFTLRDGEFVLRGRSGAPALENATLDLFLRSHDLSALFPMGFAPHVCVEPTLRETHDLGYNPYVVEDACGARGTPQHEHVFAV